MHLMPIWRIRNRLGIRVPLFAMPGLAEKVIIQLSLRTQKSGLSRIRLNDQLAESLPLALFLSWMHVVD
jgi:hypothetical protein